jgi:uncharacterized membrane protein HdeD (DUF308 family)
MTAEGVIRAGVRVTSRWWWLFLASGILWLMISLVVLRFTTTSITTIGILIGVVFTVATIEEFLIAGFSSGGWMVVHFILGTFFMLGAIWGYANPKDAFWALASVLGFLLVVYGTFEIAESVMTRALNPLWWLGLTAGILLILLGFWAGQQLLVVKGQLLIFYVGLAAMFRGFAQIVAAFQVRAMGEGAGAGAV